MFPFSLFLALIFFNPASSYVLRQATKTTRASLDGIPLRPYGVAIQARWATTGVCRVILLCTGTSPTHADGFLPVQSEESLSVLRCLEWVRSGSKGEGLKKGVYVCCRPFSPVIPQLRNKHAFLLTRDRTSLVLARRGNR